MTGRGALALSALAVILIVTAAWWALALWPLTSAAPQWLATTNMRVDYLEPVLGPTFWIESFLLRRRNRMNFVETRFLDEQGTILVFALTTMREIAPEKSLGDA